MKLSISTEEIFDRQKKFFARLEENGLDGAVMFNQIDITYLTRFYFFATERPIAFFIDPKGKTHLLVPELEKDYSMKLAKVDHIHTYPEYPGLRHPMEYLKDLLVEYGFMNKNIGFDSNGYGSSYGYRGAPLSDILDANLTSIYAWVEEQRYIKSPGEIELIKESCRWGNLAHRLLQKYSVDGANEIEVSGRATHEATIAMINTLGPDYRPYGKTALASFRGQIGKYSAYPHVDTQNAVMRTGDNLVTWGAADVYGYQSELERTMFVGEVSKEQEKYFNHMYEAQEIAFKNIKPGKPCSSVDVEVQRYIDESGLREYVPHHTGHAIGLLEHEAPFLDLGDHTIMEPGMVFTIEPGIFVQGIGGFRHSDTVVVTEDGMEMLTYYPRDLESLIC